MIDSSRRWAEPDRDTLALPASAIMGAVTYGVTRLFGTGAAGPVVVSAALLGVLAWVFGRRLVAGRTLTAEG